MPSRTARLRQLPDGHFEFTEPVCVPAPEFDVTFEEPVPVVAPSRRTKSRLPPAWDMGFLGSLRRSDLYDDLI